MKAIFTVFLLLFAAVMSSSQKLITSINTQNRVEPYSMKYDYKTGAYIYSDYDTTTKKNVLITGKGTSKEYDFAMQYASVFDDEGNVYTYTFDNVSDTAYRYFLLKNGDEIASYDYIGEGWDIKNGVLCFYAKNNSKAFIVSYDLRSGNIKQGKKYDEIYLVSFPDYYYEGEPIGSMGFTPEGEPFYVALESGRKFLVTGEKEHKHYSDIDFYMTRTDLRGEPVYIAKSKGTFYVEKGNTFIVQGGKEYKTYDYVYGPVIFDKDNNPVYVASDSIGEYKYRSRLVRGTTEGKSYEGSIYDFKLTPGGKTAYVVSVSETDRATGADVYKSFLIIDEKKGKLYGSISNLKFFGSETPFFTAMDDNNKHFVVKGRKIISEKYDNVYDYTFLDDGTLAYAGTNYGDYDKQIPDKNYIHIGSQKFGPYEFVSMADYYTGSYIISGGGNFAFITGRLINKDDYTYKYKVTSSSGQSTEHDAIDRALISNGKVIYVSGDLYDRENYLYKYNLYIDNKPVAENYDSLMELTIDEKTGKISCFGCRGRDFYLLEF